jgi:hypothetical protein
MNGKMHVSHAHSPLTGKQRAFIAVLLFLGLLLSFVVVRYLDPSTALTQHASSLSMRGIAESAVVCG